ncbi:rhodanese-like domain-containing protein [Magnetospirillum sp. UT-4]|uniref:rhodanese-like domain-containing protein n=1 Tax=Magnetospirillum sp. UT-4 TaxID=2681467 RepID=UPI0013841A14|nr:rhodanese-like domain-containing protein [Magnetospirillum sp. UT-4]CAA7617190.1 Rhodanese-like protein [Magnetospirillum sp. UT-4]
MKSLVGLSLAAALVALGACAGADEAAFEKYPDIVDNAFVREVALIPPRADAKVIDSRPARARYDPGHIPGAINISDTVFDKSVSLLPANKTTLLLFYCGGLECPLSHKSAFKARELGYTNVKVYADGMPDWEAKGGLVAVSTAYVKGLVDKPDGTVLIDSRPKKRFDEGSVPGAINIPDTFFDKSANLLPADRKTPLIFFCGGLQCDLSSKSAVKAKALGYTNVRVYPEGEPGWTAAYGSAAKAAAPAPMAVTGDTVDVDSFLATLKSNPGSLTVIDVRDAKDYQRGHFPTASNLPIGKLEAEVDKLAADKPIVFVCATGARSSEAFDMAKLLRPTLKVHYLDAEVSYGTDNSYTVKSRKK